jgi:tetratricopeptide (TPR) repeat protein
MTVLRHFRRSVVLAGALAFALSWATTAQEVSVQKLVERGAVDEAAQRAEAERENPESTVLVAHAFLRTKNDGRANEAFGRLRESGGEDWKAIGESGATLIAGDQDGALAAAERATAANGDNPYAHYQLGAVAIRQNNFQRAAEAFERSVQLKPDLAYGHYYAGMAFQRVKQIAKMAEHLETFLKLAPAAPERATVASMLRTLRG